MVKRVGKWKGEWRRYGHKGRFIYRKGKSSKLGKTFLDRYSGKIYKPIQIKKVGKRYKATGKPISTRRERTGRHFYGGGR